MGATADLALVRRAVVDNGADAVADWIAVGRLMTHLEPAAVGVLVKCRHLCMESRGIRTPGEETITSALLGDLRTNLALRTEFLALALFRHFQSKPMRFRFRLGR